MAIKKPSKRVSTVEMLKELVPALEARLDVGAEKYGDTDWMSRSYPELWSGIAVDLKTIKAVIFNVMTIDSAVQAAECEAATRLASIKALDAINRLAMIRARLVQIQGVFHS